MTENQEKIFVGSGKEKFDGNLVETTICLTDINDKAKDFIFEYEGKQYIKLKTVKKKQVDQYGKSHYIEVDTWKPEAKAENTSKDESDDLPF
jgi:hypothetical protein